MPTFPGSTISILVGKNEENKMVRINGLGFFILFFETGSGCVTQDHLELTI
jgi:hypothetical protein